MGNDAEYWRAWVVEEWSINIMTDRQTDRETIEMQNNSYKGSTTDKVTGQALLL